MSVETTPAERATDLAEELGAVITEMDAYQRFVETKQAVEADDEAQAKIREFERVREEFMLARQSGNATNDDLRELHHLQDRASGHTNPEIPLRRSVQGVAHPDAHHPRLAGGEHDGTAQAPQRRLMSPRRVEEKRLEI